MNVETLEKPNQKKPFLKGRELILQSMKYAKEDKFRSWLETLMTLVLMALAFAGTFYINLWLGKLVFSVLAGLLIVRFFYHLPRFPSWSYFKEIAHGQTHHDAFWHFCISSHQYLERHA